MAPHKLSALLLFVLGVSMLAVNYQGSRVAVQACPQFCLDVSYMTCPSSGAKHLPPRCNCCMAPKGCTLHLSDGTSLPCN
ncbi:hypothetical protein Sjap_021374 [Stephania japonica]|uniref:Uncharacterized protein n=1 Tax=Stephania japonica TaxID=461633 RepID=A0AAP0HST1_9MAGN